MYSRSFILETKLNFIYLIHVDNKHVKEFYDKRIIIWSFSSTITCTLKIEIIFGKFKKLQIPIHEIRVYNIINNQDFKKKVVCIKIQQQAYLILIYTVLLLIKDELMQSY